MHGNDFLTGLKCKKNKTEEKGNCFYIMHEFINVDAFRSVLELLTRLRLSSEKIKLI